MVTLFDLLIMGNWQIWMDVSIHYHRVSEILLYYLPLLYSKNGEKSGYPVVVSSLRISVGAT